MIVVCGEALIDMIPGRRGSARIRRRAEASGTPIVTRAGAANEYVPTPGGSPFNLAIGLARLGTPVSFLSCIRASSPSWWRAAGWSLGRRSWW